PRQLLWSPKSPGTTNTQQFREFVNKKRGLSLVTYADLYTWSVTDIEEFWSDVSEYTRTIFSKCCVSVLEKDKTMDQVPKWFIGAELNYTENVLGTMADNPSVAIYSVGEGIPLRLLTFSQLYDQVRLCASAMRKLGIVAGDRPKCLVHSAGGILLQHRKEHQISQDLGPTDILFYYTTTGWMMWNWLVGALSVGTAIVLYEGSPFKPDSGTLWSLIDSLGVTAFGTSAKYIQSLEDIGYKPIEHHQLDTLRYIYSTASPLKPSNFDFVYEHIKRDVCLSSITGGTDICSLFCGANTSLPVYRMAVESWVGDKQPVLGESGDLVCVKPFPCMPAFFWGDHDGKRYKAAYFDHYPNIWYHGDFVMINPNTGGVHMLGRSDGTLNPAGVRFGSAELYNIVDIYAEVADSLVVGQKQGVDER
ncbi:hypothetical protein GGH99_007253, partial [Coemansia sp. RSA 1285]